MLSSKASQSVLKLTLRRHQPKRERTVHELLSQHQAAYAVFVPKPEDFFKLFEIILLHHDRPRSPRNTNTNLCEIFEAIRRQHYDATGHDKRILDAFQTEFEKVSHIDITRDPEKSTVSEDSLRRAGLEISTPGPSFGGRASKIRTVYRQIRLSWISSDAYTGRKKLQKLIWTNAEAVFLLILQELDGEDFSTEIGDRSLVGIVTKRLINKVGISRVDQHGAGAAVAIGGGAASGVVGVNLGGDKINTFREQYDDKTGVSGLHFIVFRVERLDRYRWKFYKGINVCDSELDEDADPDLLRRDGFYQAGLWLRDAGSANNTAASDYKIVNEDSAGSGTNAKATALHDQRTGEDPEYVEVTNKHQTAPFVDIDIAPFLSEFAYRQCKLAAYYRKADQDNSGKTAHAVSILRSALRKCRFESTVRALYDLSGCYVRGIGVQADSNTGRLLRYCAGGMRRNYNTKDWWLRRLLMEIGLRRDDEPERSIGAMALLFRWRCVGSQEDARVYLEREDLEKAEQALLSLPSSRDKKKKLPNVLQARKEALLKAFDKEPYPELAKKVQLAEQLGITTAQISKWFQRRRESLTGLGLFKAQYNRTRRTSEELDVLLTAFEEDRYPTAERLAQLEAQLTGVTAKQIKLWFKHRRKQVHKRNRTSTSSVTTFSSQPQLNIPAQNNPNVPRLVLPVLAAVSSQYPIRNDCRSGPVIAAMPRADLPAPAFAVAQTTSRPPLPYTFDPHDCSHKGPPIMPQSQFSELELMALRGAQAVSNNAKPSQEGIVRLAQMLNRPYNLLNEWFRAQDSIRQLYVDTDDAQQPFKRRRLHNIMSSSALTDRTMIRPYGTGQASWALQDYLKESDTPVTAAQDTETETPPGSVPSL